MVDSRGVDGFFQKISKKIFFDFFQLGGPSKNFEKIEKISKCQNEPKTPLRGFHRQKIRFRAKFGYVIHLEIEKNEFLG